LVEARAIFCFFIYIFGASTDTFGFLLKTYRYNISKIPAVFTRSKTTNQILLPSLAAFQSAIPFQMSVHKTTTANNNPAAPTKPAEIGPA
jgi:hypothetical protein